MRITISIPETIFNKIQIHKEFSTTSAFIAKSVEFFTKNNSSIIDNFRNSKRMQPQKVHECNDTYINFVFKALKRKNPSDNDRMSNERKLLIKIAIEQYGTQRIQDAITCCDNMKLLDCERFSDLLEFSKHRNKTAKNNKPKQDPRIKPNHIETGYITLEDGDMHELIKEDDGTYTIKQYN